MKKVKKVLRVVVIALLLFGFLTSCSKPKQYIATADKCYTCITERAANIDSSGVEFSRVTYSDTVVCGVDSTYINSYEKDRTYKSVEQTETTYTVVYYGTSCR